MHILLPMIVRRVCFGLIAMLVISVIVFLIVRFLPGDVAETILGQSATPESIAAIRRSLGLDVSPGRQYFRWLFGIVQGDLGTSLASHREVSELVFPRLVNSLALTAYAAVFAVPLAIVFGTLSALYRDSVFDRVVNVVAFTWVSLPEFVIGYILIFIFAIKLQLFPSLSALAGSLSVADYLYKMTLPAITLMVMVFAHMTRTTRAAIINLFSSPYIEMARLKGLRKTRIVFYHALPNALAPIITVIALNLAYLVVGVVVVEVIFVYPGLGQLLVDSVAKRDVPVVQACCLIFAGIYISLNLMADILTIATNPRLLYRR